MRKSFTELNDYILYCRNTSVRDVFECEAWESYRLALSYACGEKGETCMFICSNETVWEESFNHFPNSSHFSSVRKFQCDILWRC